MAAILERPAIAASQSASVAAPATPARRVLVVGLRSRERDAIAPLLARSDFEVDRLGRARAALELLASFCFDLVVLRYPLPDLDIDELLRAMRHREARNRRSAVLVLVGPAEEARARSFIGRGANRVLPIESTESRLVAEVAALIKVAPRKSARLPTRLEVKLANGAEVVLGMTQNLCLSGMLVETELALDCGDLLEFEFMLGHRPVHGTAEVVRRASPEHERVAGFGCRFVAFEGDSRRRFQGYLERL